MIEILKNKVFKDSVIGVVCKIISAAIGFYSVPLLLSSIGVNTYGLWVTLISIIGWFQLMDFGIANGLKNKIAQHYCMSDFRQVKIFYIAAIHLYVLISIGLLVVVLLSALVIKVDYVLTYLLYIPFVLCLPITLANAVLSGIRKNGLMSCLNLINPFLWILSLSYLNFKGNVSLIEVIFFWNIISGIALSILFGVSLKLCKLKLRDIFSFGYIQKAKGIFQVSYKFFILQISSLVLFSIGNIMTYSNLGGFDVARFDTINKIFLFAISLFSVVIATAWPDFVMYFKKQMFDKAEKLHRRIFLIAVITGVGALFCSIFVPSIIQIWTQGKIEVSINEVIPFALLILIQMVAYSGAVVLNAVEDVNGQIKIAMLAAILLIPLAKILFSWGFGITAVPIASLIVILPSLFYCSYKARKIILRRC